MSGCSICGSATALAFHARMLERYDVEYRVCTTCGFLQTEAPYWLDEAYSSALSGTDTGVVARNYASMKRVALLMHLGRLMHMPAVDVGGAHGLFTRMMRDFGADFFWEDKYAVNLFAPGFESAALKGPVGLVTAFEVLEHLPDPVAFLSEINKRLRPDFIMTSTEVMPAGRVPGRDWHYYAFGHGQHVSFYTQKSLQLLGSHLGMAVAVGPRWQLFSRTTRPQELLLRVSTSRLAAASFPILRRCVTSRTASDHELLLKMTHADNCVETRSDH